MPCLPSLTGKLSVTSWSTHHEAVSVKRQAGVNDVLHVSFHIWKRTRVSALMSSGVWKWKYLSQIEKLTSYFGGKGEKKILSISNVPVCCRRKKEKKLLVWAENEKKKKKKMAWWWQWQCRYPSCAGWKLAKIFALSSLSEGLLMW